MSATPPRPDPAISARLRAAARPDEVISPITPWLLDEGRWCPPQLRGERWPSRLVSGVLEPRRGYRFRPENVALAELLVCSARPAPKRICELGAGSGSLFLIALALASPGARGAAIERQDQVAERLERTLAAHELSGRAAVLAVDLREPDVLDGVRSGLGGAADLVVCNPPWFPAQWGRASAEASVHASTHALHGGVADFMAAAAALMSPGGRCLAVYDASRMAELLVAAGAAGLALRRAVWLPDARPGRETEATRIWVELVGDGSGASMERLGSVSAPSGRAAERARTSSDRPPS